MRKGTIVAMVMLASAVAAQAQNVMKVATSRVLTEADVAASGPQKQMNSMFGMELRQYLSSSKVRSQMKKAAANGEKAVPSVSVMVMLMPKAGVTAEVLEGAGCKVNWAMKSQAFVTVPVDKLEALADINGVLGINLPEKYQLHNNIAREETHVSTIADPDAAVAEGLPQAYDGSGVIVGVVDTGIDFGHPAFRNADGTTRIKRAFTYRRTDMIQPDEPENNWRNTYTDPEEILSVTPLTTDTHGSHTMGTAAGSNTGNNMQGMAPGADLVPADLIVLYDSYLVSGLASICEYAEEVGKPVVINYSIGSPGAYRDGCSAVSQAVIELTENGTKPGVIFSFSAGNDGDSNSYVHHTFTSDNEKLYVMMDAPSDIAMVNLEGEMIQTHPVHSEENLIGYAHTDVYDAEEMLTAYSLSEKRVLNADEVIGFAALYGEMMENGQYRYSLVPSEDLESLGLYQVSIGFLRSVLKSDNQYGVSLHNCCDGVTKKRSTAFLISNDMQILLLEDVRLGGCFSMPAGTELSVLYRTEYMGGELIKPEGFDFVHAGTTEGSINEQACNMANISVGAYSVRNKFTNYFGDNLSAKYPIGEVVDFTSYGYTRDGNNLPKPEVLAPGSFILSAVNGNYASYFNTYGNLLPKEEIARPEFLAQKMEFGGKNYWYEYMQGTSMAAPVVTGTIALWLQAAPTLSVRDIREVLEHSSAPYIGDNPIQSSLYGKIDALAGLKYIIDKVTGIDDITYSQTADSSDQRIFTLDGRQVHGTPSHGIYVMGGKKVLR